MYVPLQLTESRMKENVLFVYPQNLGSNAGEYPHYVTFTAIALSLIHI